MAIGSSDGTFYDDHLDYVLNAPRPTVRIFPQKGPRDPGDDAMELDPNINDLITNDKNIINPNTTPTMPLGGPTEPRGALKSIGGTETPENVSRQESYGVKAYRGANPPGKFDTPLEPDDEWNFMVWKHENAPLDSGEDYDLRGAFKAGILPDPQSGHWPDTYKKPNHPTFSDQSQYAKDRPDLAGHWEGDNYVPPTPKSDLPNAPFGVASAAEIPEGSNVGQGGSSFFRDILHNIITLPRRAIENSQFALDTGNYDPKVPVEAALTSAIAGAPGIEKGAVGAGGGNLDAYINMFIKQPNIKKIPINEIPSDGIEASIMFHKIYNEQGSKQAISFAHKFEETASEEQFFRYEKHVNEIKYHPESNAFGYEDKITSDPFIPWEQESGKYSKPSPKEMYLKGVQDAHAQLMNDMMNAKAKYLREARGGKEIDPAELGYTTPAYRGIHTHDNKINSVYDYGGEWGRLYSTDSVELADMYSSYLSHHPGWEVPPGTFGHGATVSPLLIDTSNYHVVDAAGRHWTYANGPAIEEAIALKKPGVIVKNVWDEPNSTKALPKPNTVYITFPSGASTVKSKFAKNFDRSSPDMLNMIPVIGVGGAAGYVSTQGRTDE